MRVAAQLDNHLAPWPADSPRHRIFRAIGGPDQDLWGPRCLLQKDHRVEHRDRSSQRSRLLEQLKRFRWIRGNAKTIGVHEAKASQAIGIFLSRRLLVPMPSEIVVLAIEVEIAKLGHCVGVASRG